MSMVQQAIEIGAPLQTVYEQIAAFENYPRFMTGVERVTPIGADRTHWVMDVDGHRREFDAQIIERSPNERVSWATTEGPLLAETITLRPMGETRTQVVAQLEADIAYLMPSDRHGQETLTRRLKEDLATFKGLVESGVLGGHSGTASTEQIAEPTGTVFGGAELDPPSPASVAARIRRRATPEPHPGAGWGTGSGDTTTMGEGDEGASRAMGLGVDAERPGRRLATPGQISGGPVGGGPGSGSAPMGGRTPGRDAWGDGMINEEERGSAYDY